MSDKKKIIDWWAGVAAASYGVPYTNLLTYLNSNGITPPSDDQAEIFDNALTSAYNSTLWDKIVGFWYFKNYGKSFGQVNIKNPGTYNLTEVGTMTYTEGQGINSSNTSSWYNTGINPTTVNVYGLLSKLYARGSTANMIGARVGSTNNLTLLDAGTLRYGVNNATKNITWPSVWNSSGGPTTKFSHWMVQRSGGTTYLYDAAYNLQDTNVTAELTKANTNILINALGDPTTPQFIATGLKQIISMVFNQALTVEEIFNLCFLLQKVQSSYTNVYGLYSSTIKDWVYTDTPDVYLILGQSNALGNVTFPDDSYRKTFPNAWVYKSLENGFEMMGNGNENTWTGATLKTTMGIENNLAKILDANSKPVYIIKVAVGATGLMLSPGAGLSFNPSATPTVYNNFKGLIGAALERITQFHNGYNLKATFWIQGEADAGNEADSLAYETNFDTTFNQLKTDLSIADFKIIAAKLNSGTVGANPYYANVNTAFENLKTSGSIDQWVSTESLSTYDGQHYTAASYDALAVLLNDEVL